MLELVELVELVDAVWMCFLDDASFLSNVLLVLLVSADSLVPSDVVDVVVALVVVADLDWE